MQLPNNPMINGNFRPYILDEAPTGSTLDPGGFWELTYSEALPQLKVHRHSAAEKDPLMKPA